MAKYQGVLTSVWDDPVFQAWPKDAKLVFLNLITSQRHNPAGLYAVTRETLQFETGLSAEEFAAAFKILLAVPAGEDYARVRFDERHKIVWLVNALKHQPALTVENANLIRNVHAVLRQYVESPLVAECVTLYRKRGCGFVFEGFDGYVKKGLRRDLEGARKPPIKDRTKDKAINRTTGKAKSLSEPDVAALIKDFGNPLVERELPRLARWLQGKPDLVPKIRDMVAFARSWVGRAAQGERDLERLGALTRGIGNVGG